MYIISFLMFAVFQVDTKLRNVVDVLSVCEWSSEDDCWTTSGLPLVSAINVRTHILSENHVNIINVYNMACMSRDKILRLLTLHLLTLVLASLELAVSSIWSKINYLFYLVPMI